MGLNLPTHSFPTPQKPAVCPPFLHGDAVNTLGMAPGISAHPTRTVGEVIGEALDIGDGRPKTFCPGFHALDLMPPDSFSLHHSPPFNRTPGPPVVVSPSARKITPADSRAWRMVSTVLRCIASPRSRRVMVFGETSAFSASSRTPRPSAALAILLCSGVIAHVQK